MTKSNPASRPYRYLIVPALLLVLIVQSGLIASAANETLSYTAEHIQGSGTVQNTTGGTIEYRIEWTRQTSHREGPFNILVLSGTGQTKDYDLAADSCTIPAPWYLGDCGSYMGVVAFIVVQEGITGLGKGVAIPKAPMNLQEVYLPLSLTKISADAFYGCRHLEKVVIPGMNVEIAPDAFQGSTVDLTIYCNSGSTAQTYAAANGIPCKLMDQTSAGSSSGTSGSSGSTSQTSGSSGSSTQGTNTAGQNTQSAGTSKSSCTHSYSAWKTTKKASVFQAGTSQDHRLSRWPAQSL